MNANRLWWLGGAVVAVAIAVLAYMVGIQPQLAQAKDAADQKASAQSQLQTSELELAQLKKDYASIDQINSKLATLQKSIPGTANVSDFMRQLVGQATAAQVSVSSINIGEPTAYAPAAAGGAAAPAATPAATPASGATAAPAATAAATATPAPNPTAPAVAPPLVSDPAVTSANFVLLPVSLDATGNHAALMSFTKAMQAVGPRLFLVSKIDIKDGTAQAPVAGTTGTTAPAAGTSSTATLSGFIYVLIGNS